MMDKNVDQHYRTVTEETGQAMRNYAREYYATNVGSEIPDVKQVHRLVEIINFVLVQYPELPHTFYEMINFDEQVKVYHSPKAVEITVNSDYFNGREAITFNSDGFIGFGGWSDDYNVRPFVLAFLIWVDEVAE